MGASGCDSPAHKRGTHGTGEEPCTTRHLKSRGTGSRVLSGSYKAGGGAAGWGGKAGDRSWPRWQVTGSLML